MSNIVIQKQEIEKSFPFIASIRDLSDELFSRLRIQFKNGLGLSVICGEYAYGRGNKKYEIACFDQFDSFDNTLFDEEDREQNGGDDVLGYCSPQKVVHYIKKLGSMAIDNKNLQLT